MTLVNGKIMLPYGSVGGTGADGCVSFTQSALGSRQGAIFVPATIRTAIKGGDMTPVELTPGTWKVIVKVGDRAHALPDVLVEGEEITLTASELPGDGTYTLTLDKNQALTHVGDGTYEIGESNG